MQNKGRPARWWRQGEQGGDEEEGGVLISFSCLTRASGKQMAAPLITQFLSSRQQQLICGHAESMYFFSFIQNVEVVEEHTKGKSRFKYYMYLRKIDLIFFHLLQ